MRPAFYQFCARNIAEIMTEPGAASDNFDGERGSERFTIQPYQFEPRVNSDEADSDNESRSGDEAMESDVENTNPRLENSDWYVTIIVIDQFIALLQVIIDQQVDVK